MRTSNKNKMHILTIKEIESLKKRKYRKNHNKYLIEGKRIIQSATDWNGEIQFVFCTDSFFEKNIDWEVFQNIDRSRLKIISEQEFKKISSTTTPAGIAAVCHIKKQKKVNFNKNKWVYLDNIRDPGNLGTIFRSAAWFGINNIALSPNSSDPYNPKTIRSSMGAHFAINIHYDIKLEKFIGTHQLISASVKGEDLSTFIFPKKLVLVFGNEAHGISSKNQRIIDDFVSINSFGYGESLNVASAATVFMYAMSLKN
tara:strand:- start:1288 stop:2055 length:768 start_codon:yes stop_codon:yes gene_type:complete